MPELKDTVPPPAPKSLAPPQWIDDAHAFITEMEAEVATHELRKIFYSKQGNGPARAESLIGALDGLSKRLRPFIRVI